MSNTPIGLIGLLVLARAAPNSATAPATHRHVVVLPAVVLHAVVLLVVPLALTIVALLHSVGHFILIC